MKQPVTVMKTECVMKKWSVEAGARVHKGDLLCTVIVGKMNREVSSKWSGRILDVLVQEGEKVPGGTAICHIDTEEEHCSSSKPAAPDSPGGEKRAVLMPKAGSSAAAVKKWYKSIGDPVAAGEALVSVSAGKMNRDIRSDCAGVLEEIVIQEGAAAEGDTLGYIRVHGEGASEETRRAKTKVIIIGGGPGGYVAAIRAAQLGAETALIEMHEMGGTCLNAGCIPTKALLFSAELYEAEKHGDEIGVIAGDVAVDWPKVQENRAAVSARLSAGVEGLLAANGVERIRGKAEFTGPKSIRVTAAGGETRDMTADRIIIAAGSAPSTPPISGLAGNKNCIGSTGALTLDKLPRSMAIIGGGVIGVELASTYALFGAKITVIEMTPRIMPSMDLELTLTAQQIMEEYGIEFHLETQVLRVEEREAGARVLARDKDGRELRIDAEKVLVAVGRRGNTEALNLEAAGIEVKRGYVSTNENLETNVSGVYAVGDCTGRIMLAHTASAMGEIAAENALGGQAVYDERVCPSCIYMRPEFACVGLNEEEAKAKGLDYKVGKFPLAANGKSVIMREDRGWIKILADAKTDRILGAHMLCARATDLIAEAALAMKMNAAAGDIINTIHAHPTVSEAVREAALAVENRAVHFK